MTMGKPPATADMFLVVCLMALSSVAHGKCIHRSEKLTCRGSELLREIPTMKQESLIFIRDADFRGCDLNRMTFEMILNFLPNLRQLDIRETGRCFDMYDEKISIRQNCATESSHSTNLENVTHPVDLPSRKIPKIAILPPTSTALSPESNETTQPFRYIRPDHPLASLSFRDQIIIWIVVAVIITAAVTGLCLWFFKCLKCNSSRCPEEPRCLKEQYNNNMQADIHGYSTTEGIPVETLSMESIDLWTRPDRSKRD